MNLDVFGPLSDFFARPYTQILIDLGDILLVSFIVYRTLVLVRGTRAMQMGIGLAILFLAYQFAQRFGLATVFTLLDTVITYLVLIVVVIFQHDIRRALMRFGRRPFFRPGGAQDTHVFEEVIKAVTQLGQKRVGALIVLERDAPLDEFVEPGTELDAAVTKELLFSIFIPSFQNPMHDGAVLIRDGRVAQAGAFLPLPAGTKLDRHFGTRHRAAIGITEETDAVAIVVSEERGTVSLCDHGNIIRDLDADSLREALVGLFHRGRGVDKGSAILTADARVQPSGRTKDATGVEPLVSKEEASRLSAASRASESVEESDEVADKPIVEPSSDSGPSTSGASTPADEGDEPVVSSFSEEAGQGPVSDEAGAPARTHQGDAVAADNEGG